MNGQKYVVFTDLDGTLLDHDTYSFTEAESALERLKEQGIPVIFCTSKTRAEIEVYRDKMGINDPFAVENGGAIYIPQDYFDFEYEYEKTLDNYNVIELGSSYDKLREVLNEIKQQVPTCRVKAFGDISAEEISQDTGLDIEAAELAKQREYDEAFELDGYDVEIKRVLALINTYGLSYTQGSRYYHITGNNDKGKATRVLIALFKQKWQELKTVGLGDSFNDFTMLQKVDIPVLVQGPDGEYDLRAGLPELIRAEGIGPVGWNSAIMDILNE